MATNQPDQWTTATSTRGRQTQDDTPKDSKLAKTIDHWLNPTITSNRFTALQTEETQDDNPPSGKEATPKPPPIYITNVTITHKQTNSTDTTDGQTFDKCQMYTDHKKQLNQQGSYRQRTNTIDYINNLIVQHSIDSYEDFQRKIPSPIKIRLLKDIGYIGQNLVRQLIKIHNTDILQKNSFTKLS
jgi:hypothetical protein